jgi:nucleoside-diphosphate-sugar epimerase
MVLKNVLITGSSGKIGKKLCSYLSGNGWVVTELMGRLEDKESLKKQLKGVEQVIHLAVYQNSHDKNYKNFYETNVLGTRNLLNLVDKKAIKKIIYFSSEVVWGDPKEMDNYAKSKAEALKLVKNFESKLPIVSVFPSVVIDRDNPCPPKIWWQRMVWNLAGGFPGALATIGGNKDRKIKVIMIEELVKKIEDLLNRDLKIKEYDLGGREYSLGEYRKFMKKFFKK